MPILVGIDGTGAFFDSTYAEDFADSFVRRLCPEGNLNKKYFRGPIGPGGGLADAISAGHSFIVSRNGYAGRNNDILLTGYSRGGLGVLVIAERLKQLNIPVKAMLLFDAVDRHVAFDAPVVPNNVANVLHLRRNPLTHSRDSFGNCGTSAVAPTQYKESFFMCTHGGVGGTYWKQGDHRPTDIIHEGFPDSKDTTVTYEQDQRVSGQVWNFAQEFIHKYNFV